MNLLQKLGLYSNFVHTSVGKGIDVTEKVHLTISDFAFTTSAAMAQTDSKELKESKETEIEVNSLANDLITIQTDKNKLKETKHAHDKQVTDTYSMIRQLNQHIGLAVGEFIRDVDNGKQMLTMLEAQ